MARVCTSNAWPYAEERRLPPSSPCRASINPNTAVTYKALCSHEFWGLTGNTSGTRCDSHRALNTPTHTQAGLTEIVCTQTPVTLIKSEVKTDSWLCNIMPKYKFIFLERNPKRNLHSVLCFQYMTSDPSGKRFLRAILIVNLFLTFT